MVQTDHANCSGGGTIVYTNLVEINVGRYWLRVNCLKLDLVKALQIRKVAL